MFIVDVKQHNNNNNTFQSFTTTFINTMGMALSGELSCTRTGFVSIGLDNAVAVDETGTRIADFELLHVVDANLQRFQVQSNRELKVYKYTHVFFLSHFYQGKQLL